MKTIFIIISIIFAVRLSAQAPYNVYYGNLHSHTSYSDGELTPWDAYLYARDSAGLDFLAVTDHMEQVSSSELSQTQDFAQLATSSTFTALWGYEWGSPYYGHVNVFNITEMPSVFTYTNWSGFRQWLIDRPAVFAQFNHPGDEDYFNNWYDFEYKGAATDECFPLIEFQNIQQADDWYELSLNNGWHLSPVWNQDNHSADWGNKNNGRAGIWSEALNQTSLFEAIRAGRTFATMDKNCSVWFTSDNNIMGSTCVRYGNMPFRIVLNDDDNESWNTVELRSGNGILISFSKNGNIDTTLFVTSYYDNYLYVRAIQSDSDYVWSSPIYLEGTITSLKTNELNNFKIYPVPAYDYICIESNNKYEVAEVSLISPSGIVEKKETITLTGVNKNCISVSDIKPGLYFLEINTNGNNQINKVIIR